MLLATVLMAPNITANPSIWRIDSSRSEAHFQVNLRVPIKAEGRFTAVDGEVNLLPDFKRNVRVHLNARELQMSGPNWVQHATVSRAFLDTQNFQKIDFQSNDFSEQVLISGGEIKGMLTIKDISRSVVFKVLPSTCRRTGLSCSIEVNGVVNRRDFKMNANRWSVKDEVRFHFQLKFIQ